MRRATRLKAVYPVSIVVEAGTSPSRRRLRPALLALSIAAAFTSLPIASQGILPVHRADVVGTSARAVNAAGTQLTVTTTNGVGANHSAINWQSFSIGAGNTTQFVQPSANSTSINRVVTNTPSQIYGTLSSNGKLVLVNQSGITVGAGAVVDTAGFTASVLGMSEVDAAAGRLRFSADSLGNGTGALVVQGNVIARGGDVVLIAPSVEVAKTAVVESQGGAVILAAGQKVEVTGRGLEGIVMQVQAPGDSAVNLGTLRGDAVGIFASQLRHSGLIQAVGVTSVGGKVLLQANDLAEITGRIEAQRITTTGSNGGDVTVKAGYAVVTGAIDASGQQGGSVTIDAQAVLQAAPISVAGVTSGGVVLVRGTGSVVQTAEAVIQADAAQGTGGSVTVQAGADGTVLSSATVTAGGNTGGTVQILGGTLRLQAAQISADGDEAGGTLLVGGDRHGNNPFVPNSKYLYVNSASMLSASSRRRGNGGTVVLWSDGTTRFFGDIQAHGAGSGKAGGWVEVSGKDAVQYGGSVNAAGGPGGADGTLLLDPKNITIGAAPGQLGVIELVDPNHGASGAGDFGATILESGASRVLVTDPSDNHGSTAASNSGAIYVYDKTSGSLLTAITGSASGDNVGQNYQSLGTNRYVFQSATAAGGAGAWTWIDIGSSSVLPTSGVASAANSLVGISAGDLNGATLSSTSGRMLFIAPNYAGTRGAFTTLPTTGFVGTLSSANAILGDVAGDQLGSGRYQGLYNGSNNNVAVLSPNWGGNRGAITVIDTTLPVNGNITLSNSLVGLTGSDTMGGTGDQVGSSSGRIVQLSNNSVFVFTSNWGGGKGAVSVFDTPATVTGTVTGGNSLTGSTPTDGQNFSVQSCYFYGYCYPASYGYRADYLLVTNPQWNGGMGSVTVLDQTLTAASHPVGTLAPGNSLIGGTGDQIGSGGVTVYGSKLLVSSPSWGSGNGALTFINATSSSVKGLVNISEPNSVVGTAFGDFNSMTLREDAVSGKLLLIAPYYGSGKGAMALLGDSGVNGVLDDGKALIGTTAGDYVGSGSLTIAGGNWILKSPSWQSNTGAVTIFKPGVTSTSPRGFVNSTLNSWTGAAAGDRVGSAGMTFTLFGNNNAVMVNPLWGSGLAATGPGAITLITNIAMPFGVVSGANSWTGMPGSSDGAGMTVQALSSDGQGTNYSPGSTTRVVVSNPGFNQNRGFVALIKDTDTSLVYPGTISSSNSLVGLTGADTMGGIGDQVGSFVGSVYASVTGGKLVINSPRWNNKQGAITFFNLDTGTLLPGSVNSGNSLVGIGANDLATGSVNLYVQNYYGVNNGLTNLGGGIAAGHALLVASAYGGGKGAIVNIDLNAPVTGTLNSATNALMGAATTDRIGSGGVIRQYYAPGPGQRVLVFSPSLSSQAGGITSIDTAAVSPIGVLNATNSLIGASAGDQVGFGGSVTQLSNGSLLFLTPAYANGAVTSAGAITLMLDPANVKGTVNAANSLVGTTGGDLGGSYVTTGPGNTAFVRLPNWTNTASSAISAGAVVRIDASAGTLGTAPSGVISSTNALVGTHTNDHVGTGSLDYSSGDSIILFSSQWNGGKGLLTFNGFNAALTGEADAPTSAGSFALSGTAAIDFYSYQLIYQGTGKRLLIAPNYGGGAGAIVNLNLASGTSGTLSSSNALVGATTTDHIGSDYYARWNGNSGFVVGSSQFSNNTGALSFSDANGNFAFGTVSSANSLVGSATGDRIGSGYFEQFQFANGKMLITSRLWGAGTGSSGKGALTLLANPSQASGVIDASNSLVGAVAGDGSNLTVTRYDDAGSTYYYGTPTRALVTNPYFNGNRGMATLIDSSLAAAPAGVISASNSLVGSAAGDRVGAFSFVNSRGIVVGSPNWSGNTGAITVGSLSQLAVGNVSAVNSLVGAQAGDQLGSNGVFDAVSYFYTYNASLAGGKGGVTVFTQANATGVISTANTVYGTDTGVGSPSVVNQGSLLRVRFSEGSGRVVYIDPASLGSNGSSASVPQRFADAAGSDVTITPQSITTLTNAGTDVVLQANNDIFVNAAVTTVPTVPNAGSLLLEAGRSIMVNANITTGGGDLGLYANAPNAQAAYRDAGAGSIVTASGVTLSLGGGDMIARVGTGVGGAQGGGISLGQINGADGIFVQNLSTSSGAGISQDASTYWDTRVLALETKADNGSIGTLAQAITFNGQAMAVRAGNAPANIHHTGKQLYFDVPDKSATNTQPDPRQNSNPDPGFRGINLAGVGSLSLVSDGDVFFNTLDSTPFTIGAQNIQIEAAGSVHLSGYLGSASIEARGQLLLNAGRDILVEGGSVANSFAKLVSAGKMQITAGRSFAIHGGSGNGAYALVDPTQPGSTMDVQAPSITLQGGTGGGAYAALISAGPMTLNYQQLSLTPGSGTDADAVIIAPNAQQLSAQSGKAFIGSGNPLDNGLTDSGFAVPDRQESQVTGQFLADANFISDFLDHYNDGLLNQRRKSLRNEISLEQSCN